MASSSLVCMSCGSCRAPLRDVGMGWTASDAGSPARGRRGAVERRPAAAPRAVTRRARAEDRPVAEPSGGYRADHASKAIAPATAGGMGLMRDVYKRREHCAVSATRDGEVAHTPGGQAAARRVPEPPPPTTRRRTPAREVDTGARGATGGRVPTRCRRRSPPSSRSAVSDRLREGVDHRHAGRLQTASAVRAAGVQHRARPRRAPRPGRRPPRPRSPPCARRVDPVERREVARHLLRLAAAGAPGGAVDAYEVTVDAVRAQRAAPAGRAAPASTATGCAPPPPGGQQLGGALGEPGSRRASSQ